MPRPDTMPLPSRYARLADIDVREECCRLRAAGFEISDAYDLACSGVDQDRARRFTQLPRVRAPGGPAVHAGVAPASPASGSAFATGAGLARGSLSAVEPVPVAPLAPAGCGAHTPNPPSSCSLTAMPSGRGSSDLHALQGRRSEQLEVAWAALGWAVATLLTLSVVLGLICLAAALGDL